jgi:hypothetical protein
LQPFPAESTLPWLLRALLRPDTKLSVFTLPCQHRAKLIVWGHAAVAPWKTHGMLDALRMS